MASSFASLEAAGSLEKRGSAVIHLCMSVKRTVRGSVPGNLSVRAIAMSSKLSQPNVGGMSTPEKTFSTEGTEIAKKHGGINPPHGRINDRVPCRNSSSIRGFQRRYQCGRRGN